MKGLFVRFLLLISIFSSSYSLIAQTLYGGIDSTFSPNDLGHGINLGGEEEIKDIYVHANGQITLLGQFANFDRIPSYKLVRLNTNLMVDTTFKVDFGTYYVNWPGNSCVAFQPSGKIMLGGDFTTQITFQWGSDIMHRRIARLNSNGSKDDTFAQGAATSNAGFNNPVNSIHVQADGKVVLVGSFTSFNGTFVNRITRLNVNGGIDATFNVGAGMSGTGANLVVSTPDGKIMVAGTFGSWAGFSYQNIVRLTNNGAVDGSFQVGGPNAMIQAIHFLPNGKIAVGGDFTSYNGFARNRICILNADGSVDTSFDPGAGFDGTVRSISSDALGNLIVGGDFTAYNGNACSRLTSISAAGAWNSSFFHELNGTVNVIKSLPDGSFLVGGNFSACGQYAIKGFARILPNGDLDSVSRRSTGVAQDNSYGVTFVSPNESVVYGYFKGYGGRYVSSNIAKFDIDGEFVASAFDNLPYEAVVAVEKDGTKLLVAGDLMSTATAPYKSLCRTNFNGDLDPTFDSQLPSGLVNLTHAVKKLANGKYLTVHQATNDLSLTQLHANGAIDLGFQEVTMTNGAADFIELSSGKILLFGYELTFNSSITASAICVNADGSINPSFSATVNSGAAIYSALELSNGKILVAGNFITWNGSPRRGYVMLNSDLSEDVNFEYPLNNLGSQVTDAVELENGKIMLSGDLLDDQMAHNSIVLIYPDGARDVNFSGYKAKIPKQPSVVGDLAKIDSVNYYLSGYFNSINGYGANGIERISYLQTQVGYDTIVTCDSFTYYGTTYNVSKDSIFHSFTTATGADSLVLLDLTINYSSDTTLFVDACTSYLWNIDNVTYINDTTVIGIIPNMYGCDSVITLNLDVHFTTYDTSYLEACGNYTWSNNVNYASSGIYNDTLTSIYGCDSIIVLDLTVHDIFIDTLDVVQCTSFTWSNTGQTYFSSGFYNDTLTDIFGCDSIWVLDLTIPPITYGTDIQTACASYTWMDGVTYYNSTNTPTWTLVNLAGCDSIVTLNLTILQNSVIDSQVACDSLVWIDGITYYSSTNTPTFILTNMYGCDSLVTLDLTINQSNSGIDTQVACDSLTWIDGITYSASIVGPTWVLTNTLGCDSTVMLDLTVNYSTFGIDNLIACDSLTWIDGITYSASNSTASYILSNAIGCDSLVTLNLTILSSDLIEQNITACDSFTWINGVTYYASTNIPMVSYSNQFGCDSSISLNLEILNQVTTIENIFTMPSDITSCTGELAIEIEGDPDFEILIDGNQPAIFSSGYSLVDQLCAGVHDVQVVSQCGDTINTQFVVAIDSNYVFNNPFIDSLAQDSLGVTLSNCDIYYNSIDTAYIDSIWAIGNSVNVIWNIVDSNGSNFDTTSYVLNNGNGVYWLQLSVFCPTRAVGDYFTVTEAIYFNDGSVSTAGVLDAELSDFSIFPNPTTSDVTISFSGQDVILRIYDSAGRIVFDGAVASGDSISLNQLERGIYYFELNSLNSTSMQRVVKQ